MNQLRRFRWQFQIRVLGLLATIGVAMAGLLWSLQRDGLPAVTALAALIVAGLIASLLHFVSSQHRKLERFLTALAFDDASLRFAEDDWDAQLAAAANDVLSAVRDARLATEAKAVYLDTVLKHVPVAVLCVASDGHILTVNNAARHLFGTVRLDQISDLAVFGRQVPEQLGSLNAGEQRMVRAVHRERILDLKVSATQIRLTGEDGGTLQTLLALENIHSELDDREIRAWRDLIRVLTHEIMNSVTPIASLARTVDSMITELEQPDSETADDIHAALATIVRRSEGLIDFVTGYRKMTSAPQPRLRQTPVQPLLDDIRRLCVEEFAPAPSIAISVTPENLSMSADHGMMQQALSNLVRNACQAVENVDSGNVRVDASPSHGKVCITITDNGSGIDADDLGQIFIPFFTTRSTGSGVGMTLARQIVSAHGGTISVRSKPGETVVTVSV